MLGYVVINKDLLSEGEYRIYNGYYCGVCKSIGREHGQIPRLALSYDVVFMAIVLSALREGESIIWDEHCILHPIAKKPVVTGDPSLDYAADMLLILAYHNFLDDVKDDANIKSKVAVKALSSTYNKLKRSYPDVCIEVEKALDDLRMMENKNSGSLDETGDAFGRVLKASFGGYSHDEKTKRTLEELGYHLGQWIYIMDALDDYEEDIEKKKYNPLIYRERGLEGLDDLLYNHLGRVSQAVDLMDIKKNKGIIDNIILLGLRGRTEGLLKKVKGD